MATVARISVRTNITTSGFHVLQANSFKLNVDHPPMRYNVVK